MMARIQRFLLIFVMLLTALCIALSRELAPFAVFASVVAGVVVTFGAVLAAQFALMQLVNRRTAVHKATLLQVLRCWLVEMVSAVRIFAWWQPFRSAAIADQIGIEFDGRRGVVFLHGFACNRGVWTLWMRVLRRQGIPFCAVNLEPVFGSIDEYVPIIDQAVSKMQQSTGKNPLVVCHSMGGLAARAWLRARAGGDRVHRIVTIGSPHLGTFMGHLTPGQRLIVNGGQMWFRSEWLADLARQEPPERLTGFSCFYSNCDNIVMPAEAARLPGADNRFVSGVPHMAMVLDAAIIRETLEML